MIGSIYRKDENYFPKVLLGKYYLIEETEIFCSYSDEEYYYEECIDLFSDLLDQDEFEIQINVSFSWEATSKRFARLWLKNCGSRMLIKEGLK